MKYITQTAFESLVAMLESHYPASLLKKNVQTALDIFKKQVVLNQNPVLTYKDLRSAIIFVKTDNTRALKQPEYTDIEAALDTIVQFIKENSDAETFAAFCDAYLNQDTQQISRQKLLLGFVDDRSLINEILDDFYDRFRA